MDLNQLAVLVRVIDAGSFTKAARFLKQPKSRVSRRIAMLEKELGVSLLYRTTRQFRPTEAGLALYNECREHVYALEGATSSAKDHSKEVAGVLTVSAAEDMGVALFGPLIDELLEKHPALSIDARYSNQFVDLVREGVDLALRIGDLKDTTLKARQIGVASSILVASPNYLRSAPRIEALADLERHATLDFAFDEVEENVWQLRAAGKRPERVRIKPRCRASNPATLFELACTGKGVALLPEYLCAERLKSGALKRVLPSYSSIDGPVSFVWPAQKELSPKVRAFVDMGVRHLSRYFAR